jgi:peroxiredoxin
MSLETSLSEGTTAPEFSLSDLEGHHLALSELRGAPIVLNFFTDNCIWCRTLMPHLAEVYRRLDNVNVRVLGVLVGGANVDVAREFAREHLLDFPILLDSAREVSVAYKIARVPTIAVIDGVGDIARIYEGATEQLAGIVEQTVLAAAGQQELPEYSLVGNGCSPNG